jgi:hypothetical protein
VAAAIPDPILRGHATDAVAVDASNAEAVAALAATAPRRQRRTTVELLVAYQVLVDYVDTVGERVCAHELRRGLEIGMALAAAVATPVSPLRLDPLGVVGDRRGRKLEHRDPRAARRRRRPSDDRPRRHSRRRRVLAAHLRDVDHARQPCRLRARRDDRRRLLRLALPRPRLRADRPDPSDDTLAHRDQAAALQPHPHDDRLRRRRLLRRLGDARQPRRAARAEPRCRARTDRHADHSRAPGTAPAPVYTGRPSSSQAARASIAGG